MFHVSNMKTRLRRRLQLAVARRSRGQRVRNELEATSDRGLAEMGLARGDIYVVAFGCATRRYGPASHTGAATNSVAA